MVDIVLLYLYILYGCSYVLYVCVDWLLVLLLYFPLTRVVGLCSRGVCEFLSAFCILWCLCSYLVWS
jgi:hypothetical protein